MKKLIWVQALMAVLCFVFAACAPEIAENAPPPPAAAVPANEKYLCVQPDTDNGISFATGSRVCYDTKVYTLKVQLLGDIASNQTTNATISGSSYGGYGGVSGRMWTDGKGVIRVMILNMSPEQDTSWGTWIDLSLPYILKTTDLGFLGVPDGAVVDAICQHDVEVLSPSFSGQTFTADRITHELDNCRLLTKNYVPSGQ